MIRLEEYKKRLVEEKEEKHGVGGKIARNWSGGVKKASQ